MLSWKRPKKKTNKKEKKNISETNYNNRLERSYNKFAQRVKILNFNHESMADLDKFKLWKQQGGSEG